MLPSHAGFPRTLLSLLILAAAAPPAAAQAVRAQAAAPVTKHGTVEGITEYRLSNGLQVLLMPDPSQPKVTVNCTVFVGSRHEGYGETGMAHLLEHMLFKGCPKFPDVPKALRDHGANFNGTTWVDRTNYYETMPATDDNLEFGIELEADRLANSFIRREDLMSEFSVVRNEFEAGENDPERILSQRMFAVAFEWHNYGKSTIGNRSDIERVPVENLHAFYKKYYRPDNTLLIVAGKFDEKTAVRAILKYFGPLKNPGEPIRPTYTEEPPQDGERVVTLRRVGSTAAVGAVYHIPAGSHPDFAAIEVLNRVLGMDPSGRLYQALVETKKATNVSASAFPWHDPGALEITAQTEPDKSAAARDAMLDVLENLAKNPVTDDETERAKRQLLQARERVLANSQGFAVQLSNWAACGSWKLYFLHRDRLEKVTAADVNRVAGTYLVRSNRTVGMYVPTKAPERATVPATPDVAKLVEGYKGRAALAAGEAFNPTPANVEKRVERGTVGDGVQFALLPKKTRGETVNLTLTLRFGNPESLRGKDAAAEALGPMLTRGTKTKTRQQIRDELDRLNAVLSVKSSAGKLTASVQTKRANLPAVLRLLGEVLRKPSFPAGELDLFKRETLEEFEKSRNDPEKLAMLALQRKLHPYPPDDVRYVPTLDEQIERAQAVSVDKVRELYDTHLGSGAGELAVVGDFEPAGAVAQIGGFLKGWAAKTPYRRIEKPSQVTPGSRERIHTPDKANAVYFAAVSLPLSDTDPEYAAMVVGNYMLGQAPLASRLSIRVRGKDGLSYNVTSYVYAPALDKGGTLYLYAITNPRNMDKVDAAIAEEVGKFLKDGLSAAELEEAKKSYVLTQKGIRANDGMLAIQLAGALYAGRTFDYYADLEKKIDTLQPEDVKQVFDKLFDVERLIVIHAGDLPDTK